MKVIDLSSTISNSPESVPDFLKTKLTYHSHGEGAMQAEQILKVSPEAFKESEGWATETIDRLGTHDSTHVDAPWHYNSVIEGKPAPTIDELPLEWFFGNGIVLDMRHKTDGDTVKVEDITKELDRIEYTIQPLDIVLIRTGCDDYYNEPDYMYRGCGVSPEATLWLYQKGVRVMGIDAWGWDAPLNLQAEQAIAPGAKGVFWAAHQVGVPYAHIERLMNLGSLPCKGFKVSCFPLKIAKGSAGPARVVGIVNAGK